jgi:hypothetical protein
VDTKPKLKLKVTKDTEAVRDLLFRINGELFEQDTKRLGGSSVGVKEITELLERFIR